MPLTRARALGGRRRARARRLRELGPSGGSGTLACLGAGRPGRGSHRQLAQRAPERGGHGLGPQGPLPAGRRLHLPREHAGKLRPRHGLPRRGRDPRACVRSGRGPMAGRGRGRARRRRGHRRRRLPHVREQRQPIFRRVGAVDGGRGAAAAAACGSPRPASPAGPGRSRAAASSASTGPPPRATRSSLRATRRWRRHAGRRRWSGFGTRARSTGRSSYDLGAGGYAVAAVGAGDGGVILAGYLRSAHVALRGDAVLVRARRGGADRSGRAGTRRTCPRSRARCCAAAGGELRAGGTLFDPRGARSPFVLRLGADGSPCARRASIAGSRPTRSTAAADAGEGRIVVAGRQRDPFVNRQRGFALLVTIGRPHPRLRDPAGAGQRGADLGGDGAGGRVPAGRLPTASAPPGSTSWSPSGCPPRGAAPSSWRRASRSASWWCGRSPVEPRVVALPVQSREVPLDALVVIPLRVPGGAGGR